MGLGPIFCLLGVEVMRQQAALVQKVSPIVEGLGLECVGLQFFPQGKRTLLRLYVDKPGGVTVEDCELASRQVGGFLSVENLQLGEYTLEVSSPGLDRVLFTPAQCAVQLGKLASIRCVAPKEGQRNFKGRILSVEGEEVSVLTEAGTVKFSFGEIEEARLVPEW